MASNKSNPRHNRTPGDDVEGMSQTQQRETKRDDCIQEQEGFNTALT